MIAAPLIGAGIGALSGLFGGKKSSYDPYGNLTPEQRGIYSQYSQSLMNRLQNNGNPYQGQLSAPLGQGEQNAISDYNNFVSPSYATLNRLINVDPNELNNQFNNDIVSPTVQSFRQYIQPALEETLPSSSQARANVVSRGLGDLQNNLIQQRMTYQNSARDRALNAIGQGNALGTTSTQINSIPRQVQQAGLDRAYDEFVRQNQQSGEDLNAALQFLGISSGVEREPNTSTLQRVFAGAGAGAQIGQFIGADKQDAATPQSAGTNLYTPNYSGISGSIGPQGDYIDSLIADLNRRQ